MVQAKTKDEIEQTLDCGLVKGHAYAVTAVRYVELDAKAVGFRLVLLYVTTYAVCFVDIRRSSLCG